MTDKIHDILSKVQEELKVPKGQYNGFGKYKYRSCEDILESVKPFLFDNSLTLILNDELVFIGDRYYIKATATLTFEKESIEVSAYAREEESKKGMDGSQITGASSSYARKYALNGLFLIDDTKDSDSTNKGSNNWRGNLKKVTDSENKEVAQEIKEKIEERFREFEKCICACDSLQDLKEHWSKICRKLKALGQDKTAYLTKLKDDTKKKLENKE